MNLGFNKLVLPKLFLKFRAIRQISKGLFLVMIATGKKFREIKIEVEKVRIVSNLKKSKHNCENCEQESEFISLSSAVQIFETTEKKIAQMAKEKIIHFNLTTQNEILICLPSLLLANEFF